MYYMNCRNGNVLYIFLFLIIYLPSTRSYYRAQRIHLHWNPSFGALNKSKTSQSTIWGNEYLKWYSSAEEKQNASTLPIDSNQLEV